MRISVIMPARGRHAFALAAFDCWKRQSYPDKELVIVDDMDCPAFPAGVGDPQVQYVSLPQRASIGAKRNLACSLATGKYIAHFDSDDWSAPGRLADQLQRLEGTAYSVTGYHSIVFTDGMNGWWRFARPDWIGGTTLFYRRDWWEKHPFLDCPKHRTDSDDQPFVADARKGRCFIEAPANEMVIARIHSGHNGNTSPKGTSGPSWKRLQPTDSLIAALA
jgi:glycosyltransferase involved in cell wall biosynthesis